MRYMVNGQEADIRGAQTSECDYCGEAGHTYHDHPEALQDVRIAQRPLSDEETWCPGGPWW